LSGLQTMNKWIWQGIATIVETRHCNNYEVVSKVIDYVILNLFQDPNALNGRPRNKFGVTGLLSFLTFKTASPPARCLFLSSRQRVRFPFWGWLAFHQGIRPCSGYFTASRTGLLPSRRVSTPSRRRVTYTVIVGERARTFTEKARTVTEKAVGIGEKAWIVNETESLKFRTLWFLV